MASPPHLVVHGSERGARFKRVGGFLKLCRSQFTVKPHPIIIDLILIEPDRFFFLPSRCTDEILSLVSKRRISIFFFFINSIFPFLCFSFSPRTRNELILLQRGWMQYGINYNDEIFVWGIFILILCLFFRKAGKQGSDCKFKNCKEIVRYRCLVAPVIIVSLIFLCLETLFIIITDTLEFLLLFLPFYYSLFEEFLHNYLYIL